MSNLLLNIPENISLVIACALSAEAKPLINALKLTPCAKSGQCSVFAHDNKRLILIITGVGRMNMAQGLGVVSHFIAKGTTACFANIGISGAHSLAYGCLVKASKILDMATQIAFYPSIEPKEHCHLYPLCTFDMPQSDYPPDAMVDMEGAAFFQCANQLTSADLITVLKVISDNQDHPSTQINAKAVLNLVQDAWPNMLTHFESLVSKAQRIAPAIVDDKPYLAITKQVHFSHYQQNVLRKRLRQWQIVHDHKNPLTVLDHSNDANAILAALQTEIDMTE